MNTGLAASAAMLGWLVVEKIKDGNATTLGGASGRRRRARRHHAVRRLRGRHVADLHRRHRRCRLLPRLSIKKALKLDDSLDVIAVHLVGGIVGSLLLGFFGDVAINSGGFDGLFSAAAPTCWSTSSSPSGAALAYSGIVTLIIAKGVDLIFGLRVDEEAEDTGLDLSQHAETAYSN